MLTIMAGRLGELVRRTEALAAMTEAIEIYRPSAARSPYEYSAILATLLSNRSRDPDGLGQWEQAVADVDEATSMKSFKRTRTRGARRAPPG